MHICEFDNKGWSCSIRQQSKYRYSKQSLLGITNIGNTHSTYKQMYTGSIRRIRRLRLIQRGKQGGVRLMSQFEIYRQNGANKTNLISVELTKDRPRAPKTSNTKLSLVNMRSIRNKDLLLHQHLILTYV